MNTNKVAVLVDSSCDIPTKVMEALNIYVVPLFINYKNESFLDRETISSEEFYERLPEETPSTSSPTPAMMTDVLNRIADDGYEHVVAVTLASAISSTFNILRSVAAGFSRLETFVVDSYSLALGSGMIGIAAARFAADGLPFKEICDRMPEVVKNTKAFFTPATLKYLYEGGRLSATSYTFGSILDVRPIIFSDEDGFLVPIAKAKGRKQSLKKMLKMAKERVGNFATYNIAVVNANCVKEMEGFLNTVKEELPNYIHLYTSQICPVLITHGGPGVIGIAVQGVDPIKPAAE